MVFLRASGLAAVLCLLYVFFGNERTGFILLGALALATLAAGVTTVLSYQRDAEVLEVVPEGPPVTRPIRHRPVPAPSLVPIGAAAAFTLILAGSLYGASVAVAGIVLGVITTVGWTAVDAGEHRGKAVNLLPVAIPVAGFAAIATFMFSMSRILLAVNEHASTVVAILVALLILGGGFLIANRPSIPGRTLVRAFLGVAVLFGAGGIAAYAAGQRPEENLGGPPPQTVVAKDISFQEKHLDWKAGQPVVIDFKNEDKVPHNIHFATDDTFTTTIYRKDPLPGPISDAYRFTAPEAGDYVYHCDVHPNMTGTVTVTGAGGAAPGSVTTTTYPGMYRPAPGSVHRKAGSEATETTEAKKTATTAAAPSGASVTLTAQGIAFDKKTLTLKANSNVVLHFDNKDALPHNVHVSTQEGDNGQTLLQEAPFTGPKAVDWRFSTGPPGTLYFMCDVHPNMKGTINVQ